MAADHLAKIGKNFRFLLSIWFVRSLIYSGFLAGIIASFYDFKLHTFVTSTNTESLVKQHIAAINKAQEGYYAKNNQFSDSIDKLGSMEQKKINGYDEKILSSMGPVQTTNKKDEPAQFESTIVFAKSASSQYKSYIGAVFAFKEDGSNQLKTISIICDSEHGRQPIFDGKIMECDYDPTSKGTFLGN